MPPKSSKLPVRAFAPRAASALKRRGASAQKKPPPVMTWGKAAPVLIVGAVFDLARLFFTFFVFFAPAVAGILCASKLSAITGTTIGTTVCAAGAGIVGFFAAAPIEAFGIIMAMAVGLAGWMTVGAWTLITNSRMYRENAGAVAWAVGSLAVAEVPFLGAVPSITLAMWRLYHTQIKDDTQKLAEFNKQEAQEQKAEAERVAAEHAHLQATLVAQQAAEEEANREVDVDDALEKAEQETLEPPQESAAILHFPVERARPAQNRPPQAPGDWRRAA